MTGQRRQAHQQTYTNEIKTAVVMASPWQGKQVQEFWLGFPDVVSRKVAISEAKTGALATSISGFSQAHMDVASSQSGKWQVSHDA